jgi:transposase
MYSSSLTDEEWLIIEPLLPKKKLTCPPTWTKREILDGIFYQLKNGCNWGDLPKDMPPYSTVYWHYKQWLPSRSHQNNHGGIAPHTATTRKKNLWTT